MSKKKERSGLPEKKEFSHSMKCVMIMVEEAESSAGMHMRAPGIAGYRKSLRHKTGRTIMNQAVHTENAPAAIGPYSQAVKAGNTIYVSGQIPIDPAKGEFAGDDIAAQTRQSLTNISNILKAAGTDMNHVVKTTVLLKDIADFAAMNAVYAEFFSEPYPARAAFQVAAIPKGALVEIEAVAVTE